MKVTRNDLIAQNKVFVWIAVGTALILSIPLLLRWPWTIGDFIVMAVIIAGAGSIFVVIARVFPRKYRFLAGFVVLLAALWLWVELAVGLFTNLGN